MIPTIILSIREAWGLPSLVRSTTPVSPCYITPLLNHPIKSAPDIRATLKRDTVKRVELKRLILKGLCSDKQLKTLQLTAADIDIYRYSLSVLLGLTIIG